MNQISNAAIRDRHPQPTLPKKGTNRMKSDDDKTEDVTGADSLNRIVGLIETAPKDGTSILVWRGYYWEFALYDQDVWCGAHHSSTHGNELHNPTHWMPQPPSPNAKGDAPL